MSETSLAGLIGDDLMMRSRLEAALEGAGVSLAASRELNMLPETDLVFVDLNFDSEARVAAITKLREQNPEATICGFCSHSEKELRRQAMAAGADHVVTNESLQQASLRLVNAADLTDLVTSND